MKKQRRNTAARTKILDLISQSEVALSHADLQSSLDGFCDRVTIYRVLSRLEEEGLVHKIATVEGGVKYARCHDCTTAGHHHNHLHFSCEKCKTVICLEDIQPDFHLPAAYQVKEISFTVSGICPACV